jgi:hypothetical protein
MKLHLAYEAMLICIKCEFRKATIFLKWQACDGQLKLNVFPQRKLSRPLFFAESTVNDTVYLYIKKLSP